MAISDPAADFITSQEAIVTDFVFRLTGDRSRAGVMSKDICTFVLDHLESGLDEEAIRLRLFARAFELNEDALRGIDPAFLENYYRNSLVSAQDVVRFYRWEMFLANLPLPSSLPFLLVERYGFPADRLPSIISWEPEEIARGLADAEAQMKSQKNLESINLKELPFYGFLPVADAPHSSLSVILKDIDGSPLAERRWPIILLILAGLLLGALIFAFLS